MAAERTVIQFAPGVFIGGDISGCIDGPLAALRHRLHAVTKRLFPESGTQVPPAVPLPDVRTRYHLKGPIAFEEYSVRRNSEHCATPTACAESTSVLVAEGLVSQLGGNPRGQFSGVTDFEPLSSFAVRADVIAELRKPAPCVGVTNLSETMGLSINNKAMYLERRRPVARWARSLTSRRRPGRWWPALPVPLPPTRAPPTIPRI